MAQNFPVPEHFMQRMQELEADNNALRANLAATQTAAAQAQTAAAQAVAAAAAVSANNSAPAPEPVPRAPFGREPKPFGGQREQLESFLDHLRLIFALQPQRFPNDKQKVLYTASYFEGAAFSWFQPLLTKDDDLLLSDFEKFTKRLVHTFGDAFLEENAEDRLFELKQLTSVANYASEFRRLAAHVDMNEKGLVAHFRRGLKPMIQDELAKIPERFDTVNKMSESAIRIDQRVYARKQATRLSNAPPTRPVSQGGASRSTYHFNRQAVPAVSRPPVRDPDAMEIGAMSQYKSLTPDERERRVRLNLCLYCGKEGHVAKACPNKVVRRVAATERATPKNA